MHILIALVIGAATLAIWLGRLSRASHDIADGARAVRNIPRKRAFQKHARARGFDLVRSPLEAAAVLLVAVGQEGRSRALTDAERDAVRGVLRNRLGQSPSDAEDLLVQCEALLHDVNQPGGAVLPMTRILAPELDRKEALNLLGGLRDVAEAGGSTARQKLFVENYRDRMGLA